MFGNAFKPVSGYYSMQDLAGKWFDRAKLDLETARHILGAGYWQNASFMAHQAAEKALKAVYLKKFEEVVKTHELVFLARKVGAPNAVLELCEELNPFFIQARYPDYEEELSVDDVEKLIEDAREVIEWVEKSL